MKKLVWIFPILFLIDDILGINGYQFTIFGMGIRIVLFALSVAVLGLYCLFVIKKEKISLFKRTPGQPHLLDYCRIIDGFVLGFLVLNFLWATVIPVVKGGSLSYAISDFNTVLTLVLYFPCAFLMRTGRLQASSIAKWLHPLLLLLALWHCIMYVGEVLAPGFYAGYYDFIDIISFGTAVRTDVVFGFGITRIIQVTSVFLIPAMLIALEQSANKTKLLTYVALAPIFFAVLITYTKSIWFGIVAGLAVAVAGILIFTRDNAVRKRTGIFCLVLTVLFCVFNFGFLKNTVISRTLNSARPDSIADLDAQIADLQSQLNNPSDPSHPEEDDDTISQLLKELESRRQDASGTAEANAQRALQNEVLMEKWSGSKLLGYGYGAYAEDCIRNEEVPFMYESLIPAMFMKLGVIGLLGWVIFVLALVFFAVKALWKQPVKFWCWIGTALAYAMAVQTNPFLFTFAGMSLMLYLLLGIESARAQEKTA